MSFTAREWTSAFFGMRAHLDIPVSWPPSLSDWVIDGWRIVQLLLYRAKLSRHFYVILYQLHLSAASMESNIITQLGPCTALIL